MKINNIKKLAFISLTAMAITFSCNVVNAEDYIKIIKDGVNIRFSPNTNSVIIVKGMKGDVFTLEKTEGQWYAISMFSGEYRYIHKSLAQKITDIPLLTTSLETKKKVFNEIVKAQDRATEESTAKYPNDFNKQIDYERILYDKYELPIFRKYSIPPPRNWLLIAEGAKKGWVR